MLRSVSQDSQRMAEINKEIGLDEVLSGLSMQNSDSKDVQEKPKLED